jgi:hypothetical protein
VFEGGLDFARPVGSASLACVYKGRLRDGGAAVAVKVQNPAARLVAGDVDSLVTVGRILEMTDLKVNFSAFLGEIQKQVTKELDFTYEAMTMNSVVRCARACLAWIFTMEMRMAMLLMGLFDIVLFSGVVPLLVASKLTGNCTLPHGLRHSRV